VEDALAGEEALVSLPAALVLPLPARLLLQSVPMLPALLTTLARLPLWHTPLLQSLLQLLEHIFLPSDDQTEHPQPRGLIAAMPAVPAATHAQMRPPVGAAGSVQPDFSMLTWLAECLQCVDHELRIIYQRQTRPIW